MPDTLTVLGIAGSLRAGSINRALLEAAQELAQDSMTIQIFDLTPIPMYNSELETDERRPAEVIAFKQAITRADGLLIVTPEYNYSVPGVLKNALDWASRPAGKSPLKDKPTAIMGATGGLWGTVRAQTHLRDIFASTETPVVLKPEVLVAEARQKFDEQCRLTDEATRHFVRELLLALEDLIHQLR
ncbi:MAG: NAD(P)H-dependent oxidoreductase [Chloroflexi bacterium]|nr:NAD(P)H-dependent oxidoreductase [Chloroflexota bacterium]